MSLLAIDFGTTRTKAATWDSGKMVAMALPIGKGGGLFVPSLFHVSANGRVCFGDEAEMMMEEDPGNVLAGLKHKLDQPVHFLPNRQKVTSLELLIQVFKSLLSRAFRSDCSHRGKGGTPKSLVITLSPSRYGDEPLFREAIQAVGFSGDIHFVQEPDAVGSLWLHELSPVDGQVLLVVDLGGGSISWAGFRASPSGAALIPECPPDHIPVGGNDLDRVLFAYMLDHLSGTLREKVIHQRSLYLRKIRETKELHLFMASTTHTKSHGRPLQIPVGETFFSFSAEVLASLVASTFPNHSLESLAQYLTKLNRHNQANEIQVTMVGGARGFHFLEMSIKRVLEDEARKRKMALRFVDFGYPALATVMGAVLVPKNLRPKPKNRLRELNSIAIRSSLGVDLGRRLIEEAIFSYFEHRIERLGLSDLLHDYLDQDPSNRNLCLTACGKAMDEYFRTQRLPPTIVVSETLINNGIPDIKIPRSEMEQILIKLVEMLQFCPWDDTFKLTTKPQKPAKERT